MITAIVLVTVERRALTTAGERLAAIDGVSEVYSVTGEFDLIAMVRAKQHEDLAEIVTRRIAQVDGVQRTMTHVAFKVFSKYDLERIFG
ncbi:MAG: AsnC family transcriptional regulator [Chloroflexi bacterium 13_1_40CM_4_68_4]|nr:MAG: AsnC family transcriptional regulator [Chloroflexi bacterium 13_1_40CM_4_68_4]